MKQGTKTLPLRVPVEIADWLRDRAATETIRQKRYVSVNSLMLEILKREMEAKPLHLKREG